MHSKIRSQIIPNEGEPIWNGAVLWRGISKGKPFLSGSSMAMIGHATQRVVAYPISKVDDNCSLPEINWIAELIFDPSTPSLSRTIAMG
jgi:hypothetical protein